MSRLTLKHRTLDLGHPQVMGILNVTTDSFSDGGQFYKLDAAKRQAEAMIEAGAVIIDVGGESTRPGAEPVPEQQELDRVMPIIEWLAESVDVSVDTSKAAVMKAAVAAGAAMINDVCALNQAGALEAAAETSVPVCLMHMQGTPRTMQANPTYNNLVEDVVDFFKQRIGVCQQAGIDTARLILDPGFGFGKNLQHNVTLLNHLNAIVDLGYPVLAGLSRKSMIGQVLDKPVEQRQAASVALAILAWQAGASIIRVHDVEQTVDALRMVDFVQQACGSATPDL